MAHDQTDDFTETAARAARRMVIAGVVGACALGVGLGLWARPAPHERRIGPAVAPLAAMAAAREPGQSLQIVLDDTPAPLGAPLDVLTAEPGRELQFDLPAPEPVPALPPAPKRPPAGLMRVDMPVAAEPVLLAPLPNPKPEPVARTRPKPKAKAEGVKLAKAKPGPRAAKPRAARDDVRTAKRKSRDEVRLAKAGQPARAKPAKAKTRGDRKGGEEVALAKSEKTSKAKARAEKTRLAKLDDRKRRDAEKAEARKRTRLAEDSRAARKSADRAKARKTELADARGAKKAKARNAKPRDAVKLAKAPVRPRTKTVKGAGPLRVAKLDRCAASDAGVALVCGNPELGAADRRLQRAYRDAEAAGVPASALQRQQQRWIAARSAAAREAPWAVRDVYQARIAELDDLTRDARQGY